MKIALITSIVTFGGLMAHKCTNALDLIPLIGF